VRGGKINGGKREMTLGNQVIEVKQAVQKENLHKGRVSSSESFRRGGRGRGMYAREAEGVDGENPNR